MNVLTIYFLAIILIALLAIVVGLNFFRFRFSGDKTVLFLTIFALMFAADVALTLVLVDYTALTANQAQSQQDDLDFFE